MSQNNTAYQPVTNDDYYAKPLDIHNEKAIVNQMPTLLLIDDDEIFDGEEENYISLPSTSLSSCSSNSSDFDHIKYVNSIRKNRPLPKIPDRASSKEVSSHSLTAIINDSFKNQHRMSAQQLFEIMNSSKSVSSGEEEEEGDTSDEDEEYGGVFAIKTQMPSPTLSNKETLQQYYSELVGNYKMMTPVEEVEEEDQLFEAYVEEQHGASTPNYLLEPIEVSHLRLTSNNNTPSLISGRTSPSSQSIDVYLQQTQIEEPSSQQCGQEQLLEKVDTLNGVDSMYYAPTNSYDLQSKNDDTSLLNDVQKLSRLSRALMTPVVSSEALPTLTTLQQSYSPVGSIDEERVSPHPVASFSLTHDKDSIKTYRRMATKTHDRNIQFTYTKYLMQLVSTYTTMNDMDNEAKEMRNRLQEEAEYWIDKLAKSNFAGALYIKGLWHRHCCDRKAAGLFVGSQYKKVNHAKAFKCFQQAAKYGSTEAHYELAEYWMVRKEYKKSMASYRYAASKNHILSLYVSTVSFKEGVYADVFLCL
jgi:tetratricopeptide (TPR) repeat protein